MRGRGWKWGKWGVMNLWVWGRDEQAEDGEEDDEAKVEDVGDAEG